MSSTTPGSLNLRPSSRFSCVTVLSMFVRICGNGARGCGCVGQAERGRGRRGRATARPSDGPAERRPQRLRISGAGRWRAAVARTCVTAASPMYRSFPPKDTSVGLERLDAYGGRNRREATLTTDTWQAWRGAVEPRRTARDTSAAARRYRATTTASRRTRGLCRSSCRPRVPGRRVVDAARAASAHTGSGGAAHLIQNHVDAGPHDLAERAVLRAQVQGERGRHRCCGSEMPGWNEWREE